MHNPIADGDFIQPGSLLRVEGNSQHSITLLLPDGQRILYECFAAEDCARGFRVPMLYRAPGDMALKLMNSVHAALSPHEDGKHSLPADGRTPRDEALAVLDSRNQVEVAGLVAALPNGHYSYSVRPWDRALPKQTGIPFDKTAPSLKLTLPSPGLYEITIADQQNTPRIDLLVGAIASSQAGTRMTMFQNAKALLRDWNEDYQGWPIHDVQRAYLESLVRPIDVPPGTDRTTSVEQPAPDVTAEPMFAPRPGVFRNDTAVTLRCNTAGATIHYTVDGSQPFKTSPEYQAPIMVKGTALTIKAYATSAGKKDSAVVTGIFRIEEKESK